MAAGDALRAPLSSVKGLRQKIVFMAIEWLVIRRPSSGRAWKPRGCVR